MRLPGQEEEEARAEEEEQADAERRRRLAAVFGDVLPEAPPSNQDDEAVASGRDAEILRDVPPHHGD